MPAPQGQYVSVDGINTHYLEAGTRFKGKAPTVLLLHSAEFGGAADVVGKDLRLSGTVYKIVGVAPKSYTFLWNDIDVYLPAAFTPRQMSDESRHSNNWNMIALLKIGRAHV